MNSTFKHLLFGSGLLVFLVAICLVLLLKSKSFQLYGGVVYRFDVNEKVVALSFDDGPGKKYTIEVLDILDKEGIKATFFLVGQDMQRNPDEVRQIMARGHDIGNHSYDHSRLIFKPLAIIREQVEKTDKIIRDLGYEKEILFRPPFGQTLYVLPKYLSEQGRPTIMYDIVVENFQFQRRKEEMIKHVKKNVQPGSNIVFHVMNKSREEERKALLPIIKMLKDKGYRFDTVSNLIKNDI